MAVFTGYFNDAAAAGQAGYGLYKQIDRALAGAKSRCHFIRNNVVEVAFDVTLQETHSFQTAPTQFPIERGDVVSDHIFTAPTELSLTGMINDHPTEDKDELITQTITSVGSALASQAGYGGAGALAATLGYTSLAASANSASRSAAIFNKLQALAGVRVPGAKAIRPAIFDVVTMKEGKTFRRYADMCIKSLQLQRDNTTGPSSLVFSLSLAQIRYAYGKTVLVRTAIPYKAQGKNAHGEAESETVDEVTRGLNDAENSTAAARIRSIGSTARTILTGSP